MNYILYICYIDNNNPHDHGEFYFIEISFVDEFYHVYVLMENAKKKCLLYSLYSLITMK